MHLFSKENIWSNPQQFPAYIQTSTIILWTELFPKKRREKIQGEILQSIFEYSGVSTFYKEIQHSYKNYTQSSKFPLIPCKENYSTYRINSTTRNLQVILQLQGSSRADYYKASSSNCPRVSRHSTRQNKTPGFPTSIQGPYSTSRFPAILPGRNSILSGSQHPRTPYSSSQAHSYKNSTRRNRIHSEGLSIVYPCNTKVSVFQITY